MTVFAEDGIGQGIENRMGALDHELARLARMAARHVAQGCRIVACERVRVFKLRESGCATPDHELTLRAILSTLDLMEGHARGLAEAVENLARAQHALS